MIREGVDPPSRTWLVVGIGSPHGSDRLGWVVAEQLERQLPAPWQVRLARTPTDLLNWLEDCEHLHLLDACLRGQSSGRVHRFRWPDTRILEPRGETSHDFNLPQVLQLAQRLEQVPKKLVVWALEIGHAEELDPRPDWLEDAIVEIREDIVNHA
jgi:hydrogenase maturation protease